MLTLFFDEVCKAIDHIDISQLEEIVDNESFIKEKFGNDNKNLDINDFKQCKLTMKNGNVHIVPHTYKEIFEIINNLK